MRFVLFLIVTMMINALCVLFDCYDDDWRVLCCFWLLRCCLGRSVLFLIVTLLFSALCVVFDCYCAV